MPVAASCICAAKAIIRNSLQFLEMKLSGEILVTRENAVGRITISNPGKRNALSRRMWTDLGDVVQSLSADDDLRCIVLRGAGSEAFGSGADIDEFEQLRSTKSRAVEFAVDAHRTMLAVRDCPIPTIAAIQGACVGGGLELAAWCDLRISSDNGKFAIPIARLGAVLAYPELEGLVNLVGPRVALEMLLEGRVFNAAEALDKCILSRVVPLADFDVELEKSIQRVCAGAPLSARWHKRFVRRLNGSTPLSDAELAEGFDCYDTQDYIEGYRSFLEGRTPKFIGK